MPSLPISNDIFLPHQKAKLVNGGVLTLRKKIPRDPPCETSQQSGRHGQIINPKKEKKLLACPSVKGQAWSQPPSAVGWIGAK